MRCPKILLTLTGSLMMAFGATAQEVPVQAADSVPPDSALVPEIVNDSLHDALHAGMPVDEAPATQGPAAATAEKDTLRFYNLHTKEHLTFIHARGAKVSDEANWFMRDFRRGEKVEMDPKLFDLLGDIQAELKKRFPNLKAEFHVVSAYRSEKTNNSLRNNGGSQAKASEHILGGAMDIRVLDKGAKVPKYVRLTTLRDVATCIGAGGVGFYATDNFIHVDTGRVRYWPSRDYLKTLKCP